MKYKGRSHSQNGYKLIVVIVLLSIFQTCLGNPDRSVYLGLDVGYSSANYHRVNLHGGFVPKSIRDTGISPKLTLGIDFVRWFGFEVDVVYFQKPLFQGLGLMLRPQKVKHNLVYGALKLGIPFPHGILIYGKVGYGYIARNGFTIDYYRLFTPLKAGEFGDFVFSLGMNYQVAHHWVLDLTWVNAPAKATAQLPASNYFGLGFVYKFYF